MSWSELAAASDPLAAVIDPGDEHGAKNRLIDLVHKRALRHVARGLRGADALDFGCGTGRLSQWLAAQGARVTGVDVTPEMVAVARRLVPDAQIMTFDGSTLPFAPASFDIVVTAYVLQYYVTDQTLLDEIARVLRPGGRLISIEQVSDLELGRGATLAAYERWFGSRFDELHEPRAIRAGDSRVVANVDAHPGLSRLPMLPALVGLEAAAIGGVEIARRSYADYLFAVSARRSRTGHHQAANAAGCSST